VTGGRRLPDRRGRRAVECCLKQNGAYYRDLAGSSENPRAPAPGNAEFGAGAVSVEETARTFHELAERLTLPGGLPSRSVKRAQLTDSAPAETLGALFFSTGTGPTEIAPRTGLGLPDRGETDRGETALGPALFLIPCRRETGSRRDAPRWELCTEPTKRERRRESGRTTGTRRPR
jgi:hypothetical protein